MAKQKKQRFEGIVYSTANDFEYVDAEETEAEETLPIAQQKLKVLLDRKARKGKVVTIVQGFVGTDDDLNELAKKLKQKCGVGGAAKDGEILIQGDFKQKIFDLLTAEGYNTKLVGG
ncbi:translation initiation factor [Sphingobacterium sp. DN00404]|uniref:Translation initiation factor n=1 Tax=Sphingobacterium micropteri TaxID=2763501 RepID=A0ABR7YKN2_9SPHI|nr:translation initiation factor [Sphingobacterium micropteri]MBD1431862.1 translation initiation factor [Sphingobacterium micropteri]